MQLIFFDWQMISFKKISRPLFPLYFFLACFISFGQVHKPSSLKEKVIANGTLFQVNIDKSFQEIDNLLQQAVQTNDSLSELKLLERKCLYYYNKEDVNGLVVACEVLKKKAVGYENANAQAMAYVYLAETLSMNGLQDRAIEELDKALKALDKVKEKNLKYIHTKANVLISQGNIYNEKGEPGKAVEKLLIAIKSYDEIKDPGEVRKIQYLNYANLASIYARIDLDSAYLYVQKSINFKPGNYPDDDRMMGSNYLVLGKVSQEKRDNKQALEYYLKAEGISLKRGESLNMAELYDCIISVYSVMNETEKVNEYKHKLKEHELITLKSKYNSLHKVMENANSETSSADNTTIWIIALGATVLLPVGWFINNKSKGKKALKSNPVPIEDKYQQLLKMIKADDPSYLFHFEELYPDFKTKILGIEPSLTLSDIEFCILLKLNFSTKKIAQLKFLEVRSVQNKKYRIRKKLNIPQEVNIYNWFSEV